MTRAVVLALFLAGATTAQTPDPFGPTASQTPNPLEPTASQAPDSLEPLTAQVADIAALGEDDTPAFPPGLDPIIAVNPLNPRLDREQPWQITAEGRVIPQRRAPKPPIPVFRAPLTDAFSSRRDGGAIELAFGGQTALGGTLGVRVSRLETTPAIVELTVGDSLALDDLAIQAFDADGEPVERAPLRLEIEGPEGFVDMAAFERDNSTLTALSRGIGRIWVTSLLPASQAEPFSIPVVIAVRDIASSRFPMSSRIYENVPATP